MLHLSNGDKSKIERALGFDAGSLKDKELVRIDIPNPKTLNLRMPSGNEKGSNSSWIPGGKLRTGYREAIIDQLPPGSYMHIDIQNERAYDG